MLEATVKGPQRSSQRPAYVRPQKDQVATTSPSDRNPIFSPERAAPPGAQMTYVALMRWFGRARRSRSLKRVEGKPACSSLVGPRHRIECGLALPGAQALLEGDIRGSEFPGPGLSPAGCRELDARIRHDLSLPVMAPGLLDARGSRLSRKYE